MRRLLFHPALLGLLIATAGWAQTQPCPPNFQAPVNYFVAPPVCPGQPLHLVARTCAPCVNFTGWTFMPPGPYQVGAIMHPDACLPTVCLPESLVIPIGSFAAGSHWLLVETRTVVGYPDSETCVITKVDTVSFEVPLACNGQHPLPYTDVIRVGPPPPCATCPPPAICANQPIPFFIGGTLPNNCWQFRRLELLPSPIMSPLPAPPIARVVVAYNDCLGFPCNDIPVPWQAQAVLPPLPALSYGLIVQMAIVSWCDSTATSDSLYSTVVPFRVDSCGPPPAVCYLHGWSDGAADPNCEAVVGPGAPARVSLRMNADAPLAGLQGRFVLDPTALRITNLRPVGPAADMQLAWSARPDGAQFVMFSATGGAIRFPCMPPAMCPPVPVPVIEVTVAPRPGVPIPPLTTLNVSDVLAADTLGREVPPCPTFAPILPARICRGRNCDFNADGRLDVRDLVLMARCVTQHVGCPDSAATRFDCNGDGALGVDDVLCCARVILHGPLPDSLVTRPAPGLSLNVGAPIATATGLDVPLRLNGAALVGAARLTLAYPAARFDQASVELTGDAAAWLQVSEAADGEMVIGLIATAPAAQVPDRLDLTVHFGLAAGQTVASDVQVTGTEFVAPDGAVLALANPPTGTPPASPRCQLSTAKPNPFAGETRIVLSLSQAADVDLGIFDLAGRRVATLHRGALSAGEHPFGWDGSRSDGTRSPGGVYFCRAQGAQMTATRTLILLGAR